MTLRTNSVSETPNPAVGAGFGRIPWRPLAIAGGCAAILLAAADLLFQPTPLTVEPARVLVTDAAVDASLDRVSIELDRQRGAALRASATREFNAGTLTSAISILDDVLTRSTALSDPQEIAATENELGLAKRLLGEGERDMAILAEAIRHYRRALSTFAAQDNDSNAGIVGANLGIALRIHGAETENRSEVQEAADLLQTAIGATSRQDDPRNWSTLHKHLGMALLALGEGTNDIEALKRSVAALETALLDAEDDGRTPFDWAETQNALANALQAVGEREWGGEHLTEALKARKNAWVLYQYAGLDRFQFYFETRIALLERLIVDRAQTPEIGAIEGDIAAEEAPL